MKFRYLVFLIIFGSVIFSAPEKAVAQVPNAFQKLTLYLDSLQKINEAFLTAQNEEEKLTINDSFNKKFIRALNVPNSYHFGGFDSLKNISILKSPDNLFKVITWFVPKSDGTYQYFGTIQMNTKNGLPQLYSLTDVSATVKDANAIGSPSTWYGARYYEIIPVLALGKQPYYLLLGWKGNSSKTSKKVIEVLSFEKNEAVFGKNIFEVIKDEPTKNRVIFEYNKQNTMTLTFDKKANILVFDHLAPFDKSMKGNFEFYASDLSFDGYLITYGKLRLKEDVQLLNDPSTNDEFYGTPVKATKLLKGIN